MWSVLKAAWQRILPVSLSGRKSMHDDWWCISFDFLKHLGGVELRKEELKYHDSKVGWSAMLSLSSYLWRVYRTSLQLLPSMLLARCTFKLLVFGFPRLSFCAYRKHVKDIEVENFKFLQEQIKDIPGAVVKMTIPSPTVSLRPFHPVW